MCAFRCHAFTGLLLQTATTLSPSAPSHATLPSLHSADISELLHRTGGSAAPRGGVSGCPLDPALVWQENCMGGDGLIHSLCPVLPTGHLGSRT